MSSEQRRLAAILVADVAGFSRLVGADESGTLARLAALRREIVDPSVARHSGRLFKATGDGFLVEFASAVQAVTCAIEIQKAAGPDSLPLRIGIHVGDVVVEGDDLMGDGVNIAARIEGVAEPGGIAVSRAVHEQVRDRIAVAFEDRGEIELKNIGRPVHIFAIGGASTLSAPALALPDRPSIAVLPFQNMSGDPEQEYFADGVVEDIITALSRFKSLFVIARNSSFSYKGKSPDIRRVGRELGVRYVLEGSVRKAGNRVRITGQLIESQTGTHLWADRFEGALEDVFDLQDRITSDVTGQLAAMIELAEINRVRAKPTTNLNAYDSHLLGMRSFYRYTREAVEEALRHYARAIELDPEFAEPYTWAALAYSMRKQGRWMVDIQRESAEAIRLARRGAELRPDDAAALSGLGFSLAYFAGEIEAGIEFIDRALAFNSNNAHIWQGSGWVRYYNGDHDLAIEHMGHAERLSPLDPQTDQLLFAKALAHYCAGRYEQAASVLEGVMRRYPNMLAAKTSYARTVAMLGRVTEARSIMAQALRLNPSIRLSNAIPFMRRAEDTARLREGLRLAGMPE